MGKLPPSPLILVRRICINAYFMLFGGFQTPTIPLGDYQPQMLPLHHLLSLEFCKSQLIGLELAASGLHFPSSLPPLAPGG